MSAAGSAVPICANLTAVRERIAAAARSAGRDGEDVTLVAISKEQPVAAVEAALGCGQTEFGENRAQELVAKADALAHVVAGPRVAGPRVAGPRVAGPRVAGPRGSGPSGAGPKWHFVGRLQRNKVRSLAPHVARWHSVDRVELIPELARHAPATEVFVQVNVAREPQKGGCAPEATADLVDQLRDAGVHVDGLMTVPPLDADPRPHFAALRTLAERVGVRELSMGMSGDFEAAIGEGATYVRVGSAVFGPRPNGVGLRR